MQDIKKFLDAFLDSKNSGVIAIKGDWGAGKTYFVKHYLQERPIISNKLVSFVSLFGLSDMEEIRRQIIPSAISAKKLKEGKTTGWLRQTLWARKLPKLSDFEAVFQAFEDYQTRNLLVVFDDVERKSKKLSLKDFLGLVNFLTEHADCKVIIILNEDQLSDDDKKELGLFREKLIDREVLFAPSYIDNAKLFFHDQKLFDRALDVFTRAECRNLRVIKKCYLAVKEFEKQISSLDENQQEAILEQVIVLACLYYQFGSQINFSKLESFFFKTMFAKDEEKTDEIRILEKVGYFAKDFDGAIITYLQTGLFDDKALVPVVETQAAKGQRDGLEQKQREIYKLIWANFHGTSEEFCAKISKFLDENLEQLSWDDIMQATRSLQAVGFKDDVHKWADAFILRHASNFSFEQCNHFSHAAYSAEAKDTIHRRLKSLLKKRSPKDIIYAMMTNMGWSPQDTAALNEFTAEEYLQWLREEDDEHLLNTLQSFVQTFNPKQTNPEWKSIGDKIFSAFRILCKDNSFVRYKLLNNVRIAPDLLEESATTSSERTP